MTRGAVAAENKNNLQEQPFPTWLGDVPVFQGTGCYFDSRYFR